MQRVTNLPPTHPLRSLQAVSKAIALPHEHAPQRYPTFPALERTAVLGFSTPLTFLVPANGTASLILFRQAAYPLWGSYTMTSRMFSMLEWQFTGPDASTNNITSQTNTVYEGPYFATTASSTVNTSPTVGVVDNWYLTNPNPITGVDNGNTFMYIPGGAVCSFIVTAANSLSVTSECTIGAEMYVSPGETIPLILPDAQLVAGNRGVEVPIGVSPTGRWVRPLTVNWVHASDGLPLSGVQVAIAWSVNALTYTPTTNSRGGLSTTAGAAKVMIMPLVEPVEFSNSKLPWFATRTTAAALLATNVTQVLNKAGTVLCGRLSPAVQNPWTVTTATINALHPAEKAFMPLETGMYTYVPPSTDLQDFYDFTTTGRDATVSPAYVGLEAMPCFNLSNKAMYNVVILGGSSVAESLALTCDWHIEFRTSSALFSIGTTTMSLEGLHQAQLALNELGWFFDNPNHKSILQTLIDKTKKYVPQLISIASPTAGKMARRAIRYLDTRSIVQKPKTGYNRMKATSAQGAGMLGPKPKKKASTPPAGKGGKKKGGLQMYLDSRK